MTRKIEECLKSAFRLEFRRRNSEHLITGELVRQIAGKHTDIFIHLGTSELRKLSRESEEKLIEGLSEKKLVITDSGATERFSDYKSKFSEFQNIEFKLYGRLRDAVKDAEDSRLLLCYDGGQALYLSQFVTTVVIFGPGSVRLWKPYEFEDYGVVKDWDNGVRAIRSRGRYGHTAIYYPIWCNPCYDIGCKTRPCLNNIGVEQITEIIGELLNEVAD
jgi:hypothetical protein